MSNENIDIYHVFYDMHSHVHNRARFAAKSFLTHTDNQVLPCSKVDFESYVLRNSSFPGFPLSTGYSIEHDLQQNRF